MSKSTSHNILEGVQRKLVFLIPIIMAIAELKDIDVDVLQKI